MYLLASLTLAAPCPTQAENDALRTRIRELEAQLASGSTPDATAEQETLASAMRDQVLAAISAGDYDTATRTLSALLQTYPTSRAARASLRLRDELELIGQSAPPLAVDHWIQGRADYVDAPVTLLVFFEEWCPHCKRELPALAGRALELRARGIQVIALTRINKSSTEERVVAFLKDNAIPFAVAKEDGAMTSAFVVTGIPAATLVRDGRVIWRGHPSKLDATMLDAMLK